MDGHEFDTLTRRLATGTSRRNLIKGLASATIAGALAALRPGRGLAGEKVLICHRTGSNTNPVVLIEVDGNAVPAHQARGDAINPDFSRDPAHCGTCGNACGAGERCVAGSCQGCGGNGQDCCAGNTCAAGLACAAVGGGQLQCVNCGGHLEPCCPPNNSCHPGGACGGLVPTCCDVDVDPECAPQGND